MSLSKTEKKSQFTRGNIAYSSHNCQGPRISCDQVSIIGVYGRLAQLEKRAKVAWDGSAKVPSQNMKCRILKLRDIKNHLPCQ